MMAFVKISLTLSIVYLTSLPIFAQHFKYTAALDKVKATGFYAITISPELSAYTRTDFADIRITNNKQQWVPHILRPALQIPSGDIFIEFPILQNTLTDSGKNLLIIKNTKAAGINKLQVFLKNAAVNRNAVVSGSNDERTWYIIDDNISISRSNEKNQDEYLQEIIFPLTKYRFLKIVIDNSHNDPLLITRTGYYSQDPLGKPEILQEDPIPAFLQKDSNNSSYIEVRQKRPYHFDRVSFIITGSKFYSRDVEIYFPGDTKFSSGKPGIAFGNFKLMSTSPAVVELPRTKTSSFFIVIYNEDNPPLKIEKVNLQQQPVSLIAYLEKDKKYDLLFNDSLASFPRYDLQIFRDSINALQPLNYGKITVIKKDIANGIGTHKNWWIWISIILAGTILSVLTVRLISDISKRHD